MSSPVAVFNPPPGWPTPPEGWEPPKGWTPPKAWGPIPEGWELWIPTNPMATAKPTVEDTISRPAAKVVSSESNALRSSPDAEVVSFDDERTLQEVGVYQYHHRLEDAEAYKERLSSISKRVREMVTKNLAIERAQNFTLDNSLAQGRRMSSDLGKLMLRAYNAEVENAVRTVRAGNIVTARKRIEASRQSIAKLGAIMDMRIRDEYHELRLEELELTGDYLVKKQEEKEAAREQRARLREERKVEAELAEQRLALEKERRHIEQTIGALEKRGESDDGLSARLSEIDLAISENDFKAAHIRAGYVYVISNRGAFGDGVVKIGLTRRVEPRERISELSGASVPFRFDVHCLFFSDDAVSLEAQLHRHFAASRVNAANSRKEFFFASPGAVRDVLVSKVGQLLEFVEKPESTEYLQSVGSWPSDRTQR